MKKIFVLFPILTLAVMPVLVGAQTDPPTTITTMAGVLTTLNNILNWFFAIFLVAAVFFLLWAAFMYLTSAGDEEKVGKAKKALIWAIVAIVVAFLARGIVLIVKNFLTSGGA